MQDLLMLAPELELLLFACFLLILEVLLPQNRKVVAAYVALSGLGFSAASLALFYYQYSTLLPRTGFSGAWIIDGFALLFKSIFLLGGGLSIALSIKYLDIERQQRGEYYALVLFALSGMLLLSSAYDLITLYISIELIAITVYILVGYFKTNIKSNEGALKYYLLGTFSSGILLYGMSLLYAVTGKTNLSDIASRLNDLIPAQSASYLLLAAMVLIGVGVFFKVAAVPFHMWAPDAYEGAPTSVTAFMSVTVKAAGYVMMARIFLEALPRMQEMGEMPGWGILFGAIAALSITVGNLAATTQTNLKRMLAYSSISHAGYVLLGFVAGNSIGYTGVAFYILVYTMMNLGAFGVLLTLTRRSADGDILSEENTGEHIDDLKGLVYSSPSTAVMMLVFLLALAGIPPTSGFIGKYLLFAGLIKAGKDWQIQLAVLAVINTVISFYYYARCIKAMFISDLNEKRPLATDRSLHSALLVAVILTLLAGIYPQPFIRICESAVKHFSDSRVQTLENAPLEVRDLP